MFAKKRAVNMCPAQENKIYAVILQKNIANKI